MEIKINISEPRNVNYIGKCLFGLFKNYYIYWISHNNQDKYKYNYMVTDAPIWKPTLSSLNYTMSMEDAYNYLLNELVDHAKKYNVKIIFTETIDELDKQIHYIAEQDKNDAIDSFMKQFDGGIKFIAKEGDY